MGGRGGREAVSMICCGFVMAKAVLDLHGVGWGGGGGGRDAVSLICRGFVMTKVLLDLEGLGV